MNLKSFVSWMALVLITATPSFAKKGDRQPGADRTKPAAAASTDKAEIDELLPSEEEDKQEPPPPPPAPRAKIKGPDEEEFVDIKAAPPLVKSEDSRVPTEGGLLGAYNDSNLLLLGLRADTSYFAGSVLQQGFALSSVRLSAWGTSGNYISYRFSMGQTREFSSILLPQLTPVEAWVDFHTSSKSDWNAKSRLNWRVGMFTPTFNPWWSPDLADMPVLLPDYNTTHRIAFLNRDVGTELTVEPVADRIFLTAGVFNGNGLFAFNTNAAKAFTFSLQTKIPVYESRFWLGASGYVMDQADPSSISFRNNGVWNLFTAWEYPAWKAWLTFELFGGELNDATRTAYPFGVATSMQFRAFKGLRWFTRAESMRGTGRGGNERVASIQAGPVFDFHKTAQLFLLFHHNEVEDGTNENYGLFRLRLQI